MSVLRALLDRPGTRSFGIVPIVTSEDDGRLRVRGLLPVGAPLRDDEFEQLLTRGDLLGVNVDAPLDTDDELVALWLGDEFVQRLMPTPLSPPFSPDRRTEKGRFRLARPNDAHATVEAFLRRAASEAVNGIAETAHDIAELMQWTSPDHNLTRAVTLHRLPPVERKRRLEWYARIDRDRGIEADPAGIDADARTTAAALTDVIKRGLEALPAPLPPTRSRAYAPFLCEATL